MKIWLLGHVKNHTNPDESWHLGGLFSTEGKAVAACKDEWDFIWAEELDTDPVDREMLMGSGRYPLAKTDD